MGARTRRFMVSMTPAERLALGRLAEVEGGLSKAALVRRLIRSAARARGLWPMNDLQEAVSDHQQQKLARSA